MASISTTAFLRERSQLEAALRMRGDAKTSSVSSSSSNVGLEVWLKQATGLQSDIMLVLALIFVTAFLWARGRLLIRSFAILWLALTINMWARLRRVKKWLIRLTGKPSKLSHPARALKTTCETLAPRAHGALPTVPIDSRMTIGGPGAR